MSTLSEIANSLIKQRNVNNNNITAQLGENTENGSTSVEDKPGSVESDQSVLIIDEDFPASSSSASSEANKDHQVRILL